MGAPCQPPPAASSKSRSSPPRADWQSWGHARRRAPRTACGVCLGVLPKGEGLVEGVKRQGGGSGACGQPVARRVCVRSSAQHTTDLISQCPHPSRQRRPPTHTTNGWLCSAMHTHHSRRRPTHPAPPHAPLTRVAWRPPSHMCMHAPRLLLPLTRWRHRPCGRHAPTNIQTHMHSNTHSVL